MSGYIRKHIYSVILHFSPTQNSHYQYGPYQFEYLPVFIEIRDQLANAEVHGETSRHFAKLGYKLVQEVLFENLTLEMAQQVHDRMVAAIGTIADQTGPLLSEISEDDNSTHPFPYCWRGRKFSAEHREKLSQSHKGIKYPESRNKKISEFMKNRSHAYKKGNTNRSLSWILISPTGKRTIVHGLKNACNELGLSPGNMLLVADGIRRHHKFWKCRRVDWL